MVVAMARRRITVLLMSAVASAFILGPRQDSASSDPAIPTGVPTVPSPPALSHSSSAAAAQTTSTAALAAASSLSPYPNQALNSSNDPHGCHKDLSITSNDTNIFCQPDPDDQVRYNSAVIFQWDQQSEPDQYGGEENIVLEVHHADYLNTTHDTGAVRRKNALYVTDQNQTLSGGEEVVKMQKAWLEKSKDTQLTAILTYANDTGTLNNITRAGPFFTLLNKADTSSTNSPSGSGSDDKVGKAVGIPVGLIAFLAILACCGFYFLRRRKRHLGSAGSGGAGAPSGLAGLAGGLFGGRGAGKADYMKRRRSTGPSGLVGPFKGHRRDPSFHDEPSFGGSSDVWAGQKSMELQDRNGGGGGGPGDNRQSGHTRGSGSWDWGWGGAGAGATSPRSGQGNVFREEIGRQQTGRS